MRIIHVLPQFHFINEHTIIGGYPSAVARLGVAQVGQGHEVEIAARMSDSTPPQFAGVGLAQLEAIDAKSHRRPFRLMQKLLSYLKKHFERGDIVHFHSGHAEYAVASALIGIAFKVRVQHTLYCPVRPGLRGVMQKSCIALARTCGVSFSGMSRNICNSIPGHSDWTPPVIDSEYFRSESNGSDSCQLLFVGNATPSKGLADLIPAFANLLAGPGQREGNVRLVVTTELARTSERNELHSVLDALQGSEALDCISWLSIVPDMKELLVKSDVHVAPFRSTNGPSDYFMSTLEAMAMGKVCVVSDLPGMAEVITDGINGFAFRSGDVEDLERTLQRAIDSDRSEIGRRARSFVTEKFGDSAVGRTNRLYGESNG